MKYIDADLLRKKIEKSKYIIEPMFAKGDDCYYEGEYDGYNNILDIIDSLQQKQPKQKKNCNDCPHCVDRKDQFGWHFKGCFGGPYNGKFIAEIDECPLQQEQPSLPSNLDEAAEEYADCNSQRWHEDGDVYYDHSKIMDAFKAGAEWSKKDEEQEPEYYQHFDPDC